MWNINNLNKCPNDNSKKQSKKKGNDKPQALNPAIKKYLVSQLAKNTQILSNLETELTTKNTYISALNSQLKFVQDSNNIDKYARKNVKKPTKAQIENGK